MNHFLKFYFLETIAVQNHWNTLNENGSPVDVVQFGPEDLALLQNPVQNSGPTSSNVCVDNFPGAFDFNVVFTNLQKTNKSKHWDVSIFQISINYNLHGTYST